MKQIQLKQIGLFTKTHGIHGDLALNLSDGVSFNLIDKGLIEEEAVFVEIDGIPVPFFISKNGIRDMNPKTILLRLDDVDEQKAHRLYSSKVYLNVSGIVEVADKTKNSPRDLIGFTVIDRTLQHIGDVKDFIDLKENPLLSINHEGKELLLPFLSDFILSVDSKRKVINTNLPAGYIDAVL